MQTLRGTGLVITFVGALAACGGDDSGRATTGTESVGQGASGSSGPAAGGGGNKAGSGGSSLGGSSAAGKGGASTGGASTGGASTGGASAAGKGGGSTGGTGGGSTGGGSGGTAAALQVCQISCSAAADCATPAVPIFTASHYSCNGGICAWKGCDTDAECQQTFQKTNYACDKSAAVPTCAPTCQGANDCATAGVAIYSADHYTCSPAGLCDWAGCKTDQECQQTFQKPGYRCGAVPGSKVPNCYASCQAASDCAIAGVAIYTADHYTCDGGRCEWKGCKGDTECQQTFMKSNYVCQ